MMCEYAMISCDLRGRENITIPWCSCHLVISLVAACSAGIYAKVCSFHSVLSWLVEGLRILFGLFSWLDIVKLPLATGTWGNWYFLCISLASFFASTPGLMICMNQGNSGRLINKNSLFRPLLWVAQYILMYIDPKMANCSLSHRTWGYENISRLSDTVDNQDTLLYPIPFSFCLSYYFFHNMPASLTPADPWNVIHHKNFYKPSAEG